MIIDHYAYLVKDTDRAINALPHIGAEVTVHRLPLDSQKAFITFVKTDDTAPLIEFVEPYPDNATMLRRLERESAESILYHIGYNVEDFDATFSQMRAQGWLPLTMPFEGLRPGLRASHLFNPALGVVEILEMAA